MLKSLSFFLAVLAVVALSFWYLNRTPVSLPAFDDAEVSDRCAEFRRVDAQDEDVYSLGYGGRIRQLLHGCL